MRFLIPIIVVLFFSCKGLSKKSFSFWETQKNTFKYQNRNEFVSDSIMRVEFEAKSFKKISHPLFDSIINAPAYLYSWQDRDTTKNEFTIIQDEGELGLRINYIILDKMDNLLSWTQIGGVGNEGGYCFETRSKFISQDTLLKIRSVTEWPYFDKNKKVEKMKGDTTFSYLEIDENGKVAEKVFKVVKNLHFKNE
jgi:hypothetical protein